MATRSVTLSNLDTYQDKAQIASWSGLTNATSDVGEAVSMVGTPDRSVQVNGTFGSGGTCVIEGSNDGTNYYTLHDHFGNTLSFTSSGIKAIDQVTRYVRPRISAGDGTTSIAVSMLIRRNAP